MDLIIEEIKKGNTKVFSFFFSHTYKRLVIYANSFLFDEKASQDVVQDVFMHLWEESSKININFSLIGYVRTMVRNQCLDYLKSIKITDDINLIDINLILVSECNEMDEEENKIVIHQILKIIDTLPIKMQEIVKLRFFKSYSYLEIASELEISVNTVKTQLQRAKKNITEAILGVLVLLGLL